MTTTDKPPGEEAPITPKVIAKKPAAPRKAPVAKNPSAAKTPVAAKTEAPADEEEAPLTQDDFEAEMQQLTERAKAEGLNTMRAMTRVFARRGMAAMDGFLASLENANTPTPTKKKR